MQTHSIQRIPSITRTYTDSREARATVVRQTKVDTTTRFHPIAFISPITGASISVQSMLEHIACNRMHFASTAEARTHIGANGSKAKSRRFGILARSQRLINSETAQHRHIRAFRAGQDFPHRIFLLVLGSSSSSLSLHNRLVVSISSVRIDQMCANRQRLCMERLVCVCARVSTDSSKQQGQSKWNCIYFIHAAAHEKDKPNKKNNHKPNSNKVISVVVSSTPSCAVMRSAS